MRASPNSLSYVFNYSIAFGIGGIIGLVNADARGQPLYVGVLGFCGGGIAGALLFVALLEAQLAHLIGSSPFIALCDYAVPMTVPWVIGGAVTAQALKGEEPQGR